MKWDATLDIDMRPERVSPWNIEPLESSGKNIPNLAPPKRPRLLGPSMSGLFDLAKDGQYLSLCFRLCIPTNYVIMSHFLHLSIL